MQAQEMQARVQENVSNQQIRQALYRRDAHIQNRANF